MDETYKKHAYQCLPMTTANVLGWEMVVAEHPDLDAEREADDVAARDFESASPYIHLQCHVIVENQLAEDDPPEARRALAVLRGAGLTRHDAVHGLARHAFELILSPMGVNVVENERQYVDRLNQLIRHPEYASDR